MRLLKFITAVLLAVVAIGTTAFAWWNFNQTDTEGTVTIGTGAVVEVNLEDATAGVLVPSGIALLEGQVNEIILDYLVNLEVPIIEGELYLEVKIDNIRFNGLEDLDLEPYLVIEIEENPLSFVGGPYIRIMNITDQTPLILIRVTLDMNSTTPSAHVEAIKDAVITFDIVFTVSDLDPA